MARMTRKENTNPILLGAIVGDAFRLKRELKNPKDKSVRKKLKGNEMNKIIKYLESKCVEDVIAYSAIKHISRYPDQTEEVVLEVIKTLFEQNKISIDAHIDHLRLCPGGLLVINS